MRRNRTGWVASYKDTFSLQHTLSPIIHAALIKYREVITGEDEWVKGLPYSWEQKMVKEGVVVWEDEMRGVLSNEDFDKCFQKWLEMLDEVVYAFNQDNEPDISKYNFKYNMCVEGVGENGTMPVTLSCTNEEEKARYDKDLKVHNEKVEKGLKLFGEHLQEFWW